ncbi:MAG: AzlC family ABC transporter permease [Gammaproteobacteria bacterium]|nr:AzlC family ABC transporter permease [Gammaproteobacteria bacterium]
MSPETPLAFAFRASMPVLFGYVPLGVAFGILFADLGYHWLFAGLMGVVVFAGAAQFLAVGLLANQAGLVEIFTATLLLNMRHVFYGLSLLGRLPNKGWQRWYMIFGLTDETYALYTVTNIPAHLDRSQFKLLVTALNQGYWVLGCGLGGWLGGQLSFSTLGMEFALPALFMVLAIEQYKVVRKPLVFILALGIGLGTLLFISREQMLLVACLLALTVLLMSKGVQQWKAPIT